MRTIPFPAWLILLAAPALAAGCIQGSASATLDVNGTYKIVTQAVALSCNENVTGISFSIAPIPSMELMVDVNQGEGGIITLASQDFNWNLINLRMMDQAAATQTTPTMTGTIGEDGTFFAEVRDNWVNTGTAGPLRITQQMKGKFTQTGVEGTYIVDLALTNYNSTCGGSSGFTGEKLKK